jgi:cobalamin biosynthesis Mg chelatase CobN
MTNANEYMETTNEYMSTTKTYMDNAESYMDNAESYMDNANDYMGTTKTYMENAAASEQSAEASENNAETYMNNAEEYMNNAETSETNASNSEKNAKASETSALGSSNLAQSYAVGGTGTRDGEDTNNARYYCEIVKSIVDGLNSGFIPIGTITFAELATAEKTVGFTYNISDDFVTDSSFAEGSGMKYTAGTNVYCRSDGLWDCLGGSAPIAATVDEVKTYLGI